MKPRGKPNPNFGDYNKVWKERRDALAPAVEDLAAQFKTDSQIAEELNCSESFILRIRKSHNIKAGLKRKSEETRNNLVSLWKQQNDWLWVRGKSGLSQSGYRKAMISLHHEGRITLPPSYLKPRPKGFQFPDLNDPKHKASAVQKARLNHHKRRAVPSFWESLVSKTPDWITWSENEKGRKIASIAP